MKRIFILSIVIFIITGCASMMGIKKNNLPLSGGNGTYQVSGTHNEKLSGNWIVAVTNLYSKGGFSTETVSLRCHLLQEGGHYFSLQGYFVGSAWVFANSITIATDGKVLRLNDDNPYRNANGGAVSEMVLVTLNQEIIDRINQSQEIGLDFLSTVQLDENQIDIMKSFIKDFEKYTYTNNPFGF